MFEVLGDIVDVAQGRVGVHLCPWSPVSLFSLFHSDCFDRGERKVFIFIFLAELLNYYCCFLID